MSLRFATAENGATALEYGIIAALIGLAAVGALALAGPEIAEIFGADTLPR